MSEDTLKPCPFCGGEAAHGTVRYNAAVVRENRWTQSTFFTVNCIRCSAKVGSLVGYQTRPDAAAAWNRRTTP